MTEPNERTQPDERTEPPEPSPTPPLNPPPPVDMPGAALAAAGTPEPPVEPASPDDAPDSPPADSPPADNPPAGSPPADSPKSTDWREPPWFPPRDQDRREPKANLAAIVVGLIILAAGVYFLLDRTLGLPMPPIRWGSIWPILLIVLGGIVLIRSIQRR